MKCMKCGREMELEQSFCPDCLLEMEKYPVDPDAHVHIPVRPAAAPARKSPVRRRGLSPEEQIKKLKKHFRILACVFLVTLALLCAMVYPTVYFFLRNYHLRPGQNYNTVTTAETIEIPLD